MTVKEESHVVLRSGQIGAHAGVADDVLSVPESAACGNILKIWYGRSVDTGGRLFLLSLCREAIGGRCPPLWIALLLTVL